MHWFNNKGSATFWTWFGSLLSGVIALVVWVIPLVGSIATDASVEAQIRDVQQDIMQVAEDSLTNDAKILRELFTQIELQYLSLRKDILLSEIESLVDKMAEQDYREDWVLQERLKRLQARYDEVEKALEQMLLGRPRER